MYKNFKIIIFTALSMGLESDNQTWNSSFERYYPITTGYLSPKK